MFLRRIPSVALWQRNWFQVISEAVLQGSKRFFSFPPPVLGFDILCSNYRTEKEKCQVLISLYSGKEISIAQVGHTLRCSRTHSGSFPSRNHCLNILGLPCSWITMQKEMLASSISPLSSIDFKTANASVIRQSFSTSLGFVAISRPPSSDLLFSLKVCYNIPVRKSIP